MNAASAEAKKQERFDDAEAGRNSHDDVIDVSWHLATGARLRVEADGWPAQWTTQLARIDGSGSPTDITEGTLCTVYPPNVMHPFGSSLENAKVIFKARPLCAREGRITRHSAGSA